MEVFRGDILDPNLQEWLKKLKKTQGRVTIAAARDLSCLDAVHIINHSGPRSFDGRWNEESLKAALLHIMSCERGGTCRGTFRKIFTR